MFSIECEKCKNAIPLGMTECPVCAAKEAVGDSQAGMPAPVTAPAPQAAAAPQPYAAPPAAPAVPRQPTYLVPQPKSGLPSWLVAIGVAAVLGLVLALGYLVLLPRMRSGGAPAAGGSPNLKLETPAEGTAATAPAPASPAAAGGSRFARFVEVVGIRIVEENKKPMVKFLVVNHAAAELTDVNGMVEIRPTNSATIVGRVEVKIPSMAPYESREFNASLNTNLRAYEIPDWQFLRGQFVE